MQNLLYSLVELELRFSIITQLPSDHDAARARQVPIVARWLAVTLFGIMAGIQVLIAVRVLPQDIVWGGSHREPTLALSLASLAAAVILCGFAAILHRRGTLAAPALTTTATTTASSSCFTAPTTIRVASWLVTFYMLLNTVGNLLSINAIEKYVFGSLTAILTVCCCLVSMSGGDEGAEAAQYEPVM